MSEESAGGEAELDLETLALFVEESEEAFVRMEKALLAAEEAPAELGADALRALFRDFHTIKGTSGFLGLARLQAVAHAAEDLLAALREGKLVAHAAHVAGMLEVLDVLRRQLETVKANHRESADDVAPLVERIRAMADPSWRPAAPAAAAPSEPSPAPTVVLAPAPTNAAATAPEPAVRAEAPAAKADASDGTVRVAVGLLDKLMNLVGELVLVRNQMGQVMKGWRDPVPNAPVALARLNAVTAELQEEVMKTRLQPVGRVFEKIPRMVRDLCQATGKRVDVHIHGTETEIDKALVEAIRDPLMHMVRNAVDHGIELPHVRASVGKGEAGSLTVRAGHEGGLVTIEIEDDGAGIDPNKLRAKAVRLGLMTASDAAALSDKHAVDLIFRSGFTTAEAVTSISGRGVGMDVVRTHVERAGGQIEIDSVVGRGTIFRLKMPLTLAIIPVLLVQVGRQRFAIPQSNLLELIYLASESPAGLEYLRGAPIYRLRGEMMPLIDVRRVLGIDPAEHAEGVSIAVVSIGARRYGLLIDDIHDTEEIVVKPLQGALKDLRCYSGATVLGDGTVALILDVLGVAEMSGIDVSNGQPEVEHAPSRTSGLGPQPHLVFKAGADQLCAVSLAGVARLEQVKVSAIERVAGREVTQYRGGIMPIVRPEAVLPIGVSVGHDEVQQLVVFDFGQPVGMAANAIVDIVDIALADDPARGVSPNVLAESIVFGRTTLVLDVYAIVRQLAPHIASERPRSQIPRARVLLVDDSNAMRASIGGFLRSHGVDVLEVPTGHAALSQLRKAPVDTFQAVVTDLEMQGLDGFGLLAAVRRERPRLPVIVWTHHEDPAITKRVKTEGGVACINKLRREELVAALAEIGIEVRDLADGPGALR